MSTTRNDIINNDYLHVSLKKSKAEEVIEYYMKFLWILIEQKNDKRYDDIVHVTFMRNHFIKDKDEIQLLQVFMESEINQLGRLTRARNSKVLTLGLSGAFIGACLVAFGILLGLLLTPLFLVIGGLIALLGITLLILLCFKLRKIHHNEKRIYMQKINERSYNISEILDCLQEIVCIEKQ